VHFIIIHASQVWHILTDEGRTFIRMALAVFTSVERKRIWNGNTLPLRKCSNKLETHIN